MERPMSGRLSDTEESNNIKELGDFREYWRESPEYPKENWGNNVVRYPVNVTYTWGNGKSKIEFKSEFRTFVGAGPDDGRVDIDDTKKVRIEAFHLSFNPAFQKYTYDRVEHALIITASSAKMGGRYAVTIKPDIEEP